MKAIVTGSGAIVSAVRKALEEKGLKRRCLIPVNAFYEWPKEGTRRPAIMTTYVRGSRAKARTPGLPRCSYKPFRIAISRPPLTPIDRSCRRPKLYS